MLKQVVGFSFTWKPDVWVLVVMTISHSSGTMNSLQLILVKLVSCKVAEAMLKAGRGMWLYPFRTVVLAETCVCCICGQQKGAHPCAFLTVFHKFLDYICLLVSPLSLAIGHRFHLITSWFSVKLGQVTLLHIAIQNLLICFFFFFFLLSVSGVES